MERHLGAVHCNAVSAVAITHAFLARLRPTGKRGAVVFTSSPAGLMACPFSSMCESTHPAPLRYKIAAVLWLRLTQRCGADGATKAFLTEFAVSIAPVRHPPHSAALFNRASRPHPTRRTPICPPVAPPQLRFSCRDAEPARRCTAALLQELRSEGIDVSVIHPSPVASNFYEADGAALANLHAATALAPPAMAIAAPHGMLLLMLVLLVVVVVVVLMLKLALGAGDAVAERQVLGWRLQVKHVVVDLSCCRPLSDQCGRRTGVKHKIDAMDFFRKTATGPAVLADAIAASVGRSGAPPLSLHQRDAMQAQWMGDASSLWCRDSPVLLCPSRPPLSLRPLLRSSQQFSGGRLRCAWGAAAGRL